MQYKIKHTGSLSVPVITKQNRPFGRLICTKSYLGIDLDLLNSTKEGPLIVTFCNDRLRGGIERRYQLVFGNQIQLIAC
jgi:hypothetical protein